MSEATWDQPSGGYADDRNGGRAEGGGWADGGGRGRSPSPRGNEASRRSRSPDRRPMETDDRRDDRGRSDNRGRGDGSGHNPGNNLHISGLSGRVEERDLEDAFAKYGRVQKAQVMRDPHSKEPRGFGFVTMETPEEAEAATSALNATELGGKVISIEKARRGRARTPTPGMYHGPPKPREDGDRYRSSRYDDRYRDDRYRDDDRGYGGSSYARPMRDDRRDPYDDRDRRDRYDDRRGSDRDYRRDDRYDDRRGGSSRGYDDYDRRSRY